MEYININPRNKIVSGGLLADRIKMTVKEKVDAVMLREERLMPPKLKIICVGDKSDSKLYVESKIKMCRAMGLQSELKVFASEASQKEVIKEIKNANEDMDIHGIIVELPLPANFSTPDVLSTISYTKDVDGVNPINLIKPYQTKISECLFSPTAMGVIEVIRLCYEYNNNIDNYIEGYLAKNCFDEKLVGLDGLDATVIGRGITSGFPISILLQKCNATVTVCHSKTIDIKGKCDKADIVVSAVGIPSLVKGNFIKENAIVVDVGINVLQEENTQRIVGDVEFEGAFKNAGYITPVPGGIGKLTVIMLIRNLIKAWGVINSIDLKSI